MKVMSKNEEIRLVKDMIYQTSLAINSGRKDRLQLESELYELETELKILLNPTRLKSSCLKIA